MNELKLDGKSSGGWLLSLAVMALLVAGCAGAGVANFGDSGVERGVVSIEVTSQHGNWYSPWQMSRPAGATGSGFLIENHLILTNAHVVSDARQIIVRRPDDSTPFVAEVKYIAHDSDLALLQVADQRFFEGTETLTLGGLPTLRTAVRTYGFPAGGEKISRTEGVVSRIEFKTYWHSGADSHLAIQTDSAINPGNSGGPVVQDGKVVGVAFQTNTSLNDVGYFIPTSVVKRFLQDIKDGRYEGYPEMGIVTGNLVNPAYRQFLGLPASMNGVVVDRIVPGASADGFLNKGDVLTSVDGKPIFLDGTINYFGQSLNFEQVAEEKQVGDRISFSVWKGGKLQPVEFALKPFGDGKRVREKFDTLPGYVLYAGLIFMVLDREYLGIFGDYRANAKKSLLYDHFFRRTEHPEEQEHETVVLSRILPHRVNSAYRKRSASIVSAINGVKINRLADVVDALKAGKSRFLEIDLAHSGVQILLDRKEASQAHREILTTYGISSDRRLP